MRPRPPSLILFSLDDSACRISNTAGDFRRRCFCADVGGLGVVCGLLQCSRRRVVELTLHIYRLVYYRSSSCAARYPFLDWHRCAHSCWALTRPRASPFRMSRYDIFFSSAPSQSNFNVFATTPSTSSRFPASLVRLKLVPCPHSLAPTLVVLPSMSLGPQLHSLRSRTAAVLFFNGCRGLFL